MLYRGLRHLQSLCVPALYRQRLRRNGLEESHEQQEARFAKDRHARYQLLQAGVRAASPEVKFGFETIRVTVPNIERMRFGLVLQHADVASGKRLVAGQKAQRACRLGEYVAKRKVVPDVDGVLDCLFYFSKGVFFFP